jgi:hypothetical protein
VNIGGRVVAATETITRVQYLNGRGQRHWRWYRVKRTLVAMAPLFPTMLGLPPLLGLALGFAKRWEFLWFGVLGAILVAFAWLTVGNGDPANVYFSDWHDWMLLAAAWWLFSFYGSYAIGRMLRLVYDAAPDHSG